MPPHPYHSLFRSSRSLLLLLHSPPPIQRTPLRHLSYIPNNWDPLSHSQSQSSPSSRSNLFTWVSGIVLGSGLGALFYSDSVFAESSSFTPTTTTTTTTTTQAISTPSFTYNKPRFLFGDSFRRKVFFNYEKRIRTRSPPEKVFEYFASVRNPDGKIMMTPADLMRAVVPVFPPSESHQVREGYLRGERCPGELRCPPSNFFMLFDVNNDGLISFKEYIFFVTLLSIPESSFSVAFKMFDIDDSGVIDKGEFMKVMALMRSHTRQGTRHRDGLRPGTKRGASVESGGVVEYFFGQDGNTCLHHDRFVQFLRQLKDEILRLEFSHYDYKSRGSISAKDFALSMVAAADVKRVNKLVDRVDELDNDSRLSKIRISEDEFLKFAELRKKLEPFALALFSYGKVHGLLTKTNFQRAASQICGVTLSDNVVDIIFHVFDENRDGSLSTSEFLKVLQKRERDVAQTVETGMLGFLSCCKNCSRRHSLPKFVS